MNKTIGNYLTQSDRGFPLDCETLDYIAKNQALTEVLGNIAGDKVILRGCEPTNGGTGRGEGYVFLRTRDFPDGEVLHWRGGNATGKLTLQKTPVAVTAQGYPYGNAYTTRELVEGDGTESYNWSDFTDLQTMAEMQEEITRLRSDLDDALGEPVGTIKMWPSSTPPTGYLVCDGGTFDPSVYPKLRAVLGGTSTPNLKGRFVVGYDGDNDDYKPIGKRGGEAFHTLTIGEMPSHSHNYVDAYFAENDGRNDHIRGSNDSDWDNHILERNMTTASKGSGQAHENRPPYYVLLYIIKAK